MNGASTIVPHILIVSLFLSVMWGIYVVSRIREYLRVRLQADRRRGESVKALRHLLVAVCVWTIAFAYVFRTITVLVGVDDTASGQITFFALLGINIVGSIFSVASLGFDGD